MHSRPAYLRLSCALAAIFLGWAGAHQALAQGTTPRAVPSSRLPVVSGNYVLSQNDVIAIRVFREPDLDSQCRISSDGTINFPLLGVVTIAGKTTNEAAGVLAALLDKDYLVRPQVTVSVVDFSKREFTVMGRVEKAGSFLVGEEGLTIYQAVAAAGGFTRLANESKVEVLRGDQVIYLDCSQKSRDPAVKTFRVRPNDVIKVGERTF